MFDPGRLVGKRIGPYLVLEEVARGGQGVVLKARHHRLETIVALKLLYDPDSDPRELRRFRQEAQVLARLRHPNLPIDGKHYIRTSPQANVYCGSIGYDYRPVREGMGTNGCEDDARKRRVYDGAPADRLYAVEPVGLLTIRPSALKVVR